MRLVVSWLGLSGLAVACGDTEDSGLAGDSSTASNSQGDTTTSSSQTAGTSTSSSGHGGAASSSASVSGSASVSSVGGATTTAGVDGGGATAGAGGSDEEAPSWDVPLGAKREDSRNFGKAVAMSGDTIAVSSYRSERSQPEIYIFRRSDSVWHVEAILGVLGDAKATNQQADTLLLGDELALDGDTLAVSADEVDGADTEVVLIYRRTRSTWELEAEVEPAEPGYPDNRDATLGFGYSLALSGDTLVVGAELDRDQASYAGAVYVYQKSGSAWQPEQKLLATLPDGTPDGGEGDSFGAAVALSGDRLVVGASGKDDATFQLGAAYVFLRQGTSWSPEHRFMPPEANVIMDDMGGPQCGESVAIAQGTIVVGCPRDWEELPAGSTQQPSHYTGSAYVLERGTDSWAPTARLQPLRGTHADDDLSAALFGLQVAISRDTNLVVVGSPGDQTHEANDGSAHVFQRDGSTWALQQKLVTTPPLEGSVESHFGTRLVISGADILIGNPSVETQGRAFMYQFVDPAWELRLKLHPVDP